MDAKMLERRRKNNGHSQCANNPPLKETYKIDKSNKKKKERTAYRIKFEANQKRDAKRTSRWTLRCLSGEERTMATHNVLIIQSAQRRHINGYLPRQNANNHSKYQNPLIKLRSR
ncbi:hypothetical protein QE152_g31385 [Popillia japonica]|uniref:Uncharacterized protein n=1 Tax=Popillia japonica TaxID=7064 RepID=A0AAW1J1J7_POPJA